MRLPRHIDHTMIQIWVLTTSPLPPNIAHKATAWFTNENDALTALANTNQPDARIWKTTIHATQSISEWQNVTPSLPDAQPAS